jgi:predicted ATPase
VVSESGDSSFIAFQSASDAITTAAAAQAEIEHAEWPRDTQLRVRMGLHVGMAWPHDGNYVALAVHQAARVMAAAHGGQTLLSRHVVMELDDDRRRQVEPLGRFRLRDFDEPLELFQLGDREFPAVRALPADRHNIIRRPTGTIGRDGLIRNVAQVVEPGRLVTLTGPGGVGKTRVAAEVGTAVAEEWDDGVWMVDLAPISDDALIVAIIAEAIGAPRVPDQDRWEDVLAHLESRNALLIFDNCEHLLGRSRKLIDRLLATCPGVGVLVTSREPVRLPGEQTHPLEPLSTPSAVQLFGQRARAVRPGFEVSASNADDVAEICRQIDGLPLFIELAAANVAFQSLHDIRQGLERQISILRARDPSTPARHRDIEGVLGWSHQLLGDDERIALRRLSVFGSSFTLPMAVAAITSLAGEDSPEQVVWSLVDRSLVSVDPTADDTRYRCLETVRTFARARLADAGEETEVATRVASSYLERLGPWQPASISWLGHTAAELDNLRALADLLATESEELAQEIAYTIGRYHDSSHSFKEGVEELTRYVDRLRTPTSTRSSLLNMLAYLHLRMGQTETARVWAEAAEGLRDVHGAPAWDDAGVDRTLGEIARREGDLEAAVEVAQTTLDRTLSERGRSRMLNLLGTTFGALGRFDDAYDALSEELDINRRLGYDEFVAVAEGNLAETALRQGRERTACAHQRACLELARAQGSQPMLAFSMLLAAQMAGVSGRWSTALQLQAHAELLLEDIGLALYDDDLQRTQELTDSASEALGDIGAADAVFSGREMPTPVVVDLADEVLSAAAIGGDR